MAKLLLAALGAATLLTSAAQAQTFSVGPGGVEVDTRSRMERRDWDNRAERRDWRRRGWDDDRTGTVVERRYRDRGCRLVTIQRENADGDLVTRRIRRCD